MNTWLGLVNHSALLPSLAMQQLFHAVIWLAVLSWLGVQCLPSYDRRWRWVMCSIAALLVLLMWQSVLPSLGLVFQTPSLMTLHLKVLDDVSLFLKREDNNDED